MILQAHGEEYLQIFSQIYDSANHLFQEQERGTAEPDLFAAQLERDENFIYEENGEVCAFLSFRRCGAHTELTSLYVKLECQRKGIGSALLEYFEDRAQEGGLMFVDVLKNAPWALAFYSRHGYVSPDEAARAEAVKIGMKEQRWSVILCKKAGD